MALPYGWTFAVLCVFQGILVALGWRRRWQIGASRLAGVLIPVGALAIGLLATRQSGWSTTALATLATFGAPLAAMAASAALGYQPSIAVVLTPIAFIVAWRLDGLVSDAASVAIIGGACLSIATLIGAATSQRAIAIGLVLLATVDAILVFRGQVATSTVTLHAVEPPVAAGHPLPALQDATLGHSLYGWLDLLSPALAGMLFPDERARRMVAAVLTAIAALIWALLLGITDQIPGTVPALAAVLVWVTTRTPHERIAVREVTIQPAKAIHRK